MLIQLFPLNGCRRFAAHIVHHAVDAAYFVDDGVRHFAEQRVGQLRPMRGHKVAGDDRAQGDYIVVSAAVAHYPYRFDGQEHRKGLAVDVIPRSTVFIGGVAQLLNENIIGLAQQIGILFFHFAQNSHA